MIAGYKDGIAQARARNIKVVGGTLTSSLNSTNASYGTPEVNAQRNLVNEFIRTAGAFDGVADFDAATVDPATGELKAEYQPNSSVGGPGDRLHPNRAGYQAMAGAVDLKFLAPAGR